ncbi:MFS transporter [Ramlibacter ginsenosidimutans]|uniref:MFS transporter n=1 Tax=Ramlibacter ginsenosidimutans TaxID=502333 RepID=A0A934WMF7_9BURK|nr:MFS transporter [Ramlibacter ginsenosidimutans]
MRPSSRIAPALLATLAAASLVSLLSFGVRSAFGLFTDPLTRELHLSREVYAIAIALQNLAWGVAQPVAGWVADRHGARRVILGGALLYALGLLVMALATSAWQVTLGAGVLAGLGMGGASYITVLAALGRAMPAEHRSWALGIGTAAGSLGQFVMVPLAQAAIASAGWRTGAWLLVAAMLVVLVAGALVRGDRAAAEQGGGSDSALAVLRTALRHPSYVLLVLGFFVCGFQLAFITVHFPAWLADHGLGGNVASWGIAMVGLFNVVGAYGAGVWGGHASRKNLLAGLYLARGLSILLLITLPLSGGTVLLFGASMGLLWLSTVPLTSGLVALFFGTRYMAMLFGVVFFSHQVGSFLGVYLGGWMYERTGSYELVWWCCIGLSLFAALVNLPIRERASQPFARLLAL